MVLENTQGTYTLESLKTTGAMSRKRPIQLPKICANYHTRIYPIRIEQAYYLVMESGVNPIVMEGVLLAKGRRCKTSHVGTWLRNIKCFFLFQSFLKYIYSSRILSLCQPLFSQRNSITREYEEVPYRIHNKIVLHLIKGGPLGLPHNG